MALPQLNRRELLGAAGVSALAQTPPHAQTRPNILLITADQQQWATVGNRSVCRTPNLNALASSGLQCERSYTPSAVCCPARAMLLSGAWHWNNGVFNQVHSAPSVHRDMFPDVVLYSNRLRSAGYRLGYVGKWHASWFRGPRQFGYEDTAFLFAYGNAARDNAESPVHVPPPPAKPRRVADRMMQWPGSDPFVMWGHETGPEENTHTYYQTSCAIEVLKRLTGGSAPWCMEVHYIEPHDPYFPLDKYLQRYRPSSIPVPASFGDTFQGKPGMHRRESESWGKQTEADVQQGRAHYYAYVEQLDAQIGRLLAALEASGQAENTLVVFTADHGDMAGAHRMWIKGWIPYEECYRVPLILRWPARIPAGSRTAALVQTHDLAHTFTELAGAPPLPYADGRSLVPLLTNPNHASWPDQIMCAYYGGEFLVTQRIAITDRYKYVFNGFDFDELYDLQNDPDEMRNLLASNDAPAAASEMRGRLYALMKQYNDPFGTGPKPVHGGQPPDRYGAPRYLPRPS